MTDVRRALPSVDRVMRLEGVAALVAAHSRAEVVAAVREAVQGARSEERGARGDSDWVESVRSTLERRNAPTLQRVVNATGVVLHTNLGRAPLAPAALAAIADAGRYATLEYDVAKGARGSRHVHCAALLAELTGAADALVVNNAASALMLALAAAAAGGDAIVSRGELIEIGGGFRIPEIMSLSGASLVEVGTTNRTRLGDYEKALGGQAAAKGARSGGQKAPRVLLKVHRSNFRIQGFTAEASVEELVALGKKKRVPVIYDLGGGLMQDLSDVGLTGEPTLPDAARSGVACAIASGDKLLGGPQAGIIAGTAAFVARCRAHPFARAARADKLTLAALSATLLLHRDAARARREIPVLRMLTATAAALEARARTLAASLPAAACARVVATRAAVGGGAFPGEELASAGVALESDLPAASLAEKLRRAQTPVIATVAKGLVILDVRTLLDGDDEIVRRAVEQALA